MFDFLFSNPIILIILIGVISSLLKKRNQPKQQKAGQPQAPKTIWKEIIQEVQGEWEKEKKKMLPTTQEAKHVAPESPSVLEEESERKRIAELNRLQQEYEERHTAEMEPIFQSSTQVNVAPATLKTAISDEKSPIYNQDLSFGKQQLVQGIIMSEVLGPPRAKRNMKQSR